MLRGKVAEDVLRWDVAGARRRIDEAAGDDAFDRVTADLQAIGELVGRVAEIQKHIADTFREDIGKQRTVAFRDGTRSLRITSVGSGGFKAERVAGVAGLVEAEFKVGQLSLQEMCRRLSKSKAAGLYWPALLAWIRMGKMCPLIPVKPFPMMWLLLIVAAMCPNRI